MRMKKESVLSCRYQGKEGFYAEVVPEPDGAISFWLGHRDADVKERMFALSAELAPEDRWETLLQDNLEEYMEDFREAWLEE